MASLPFELACKTVYVAGHRGMVGAALVRRLAAENVELLTATRSEWQGLGQGHGRLRGRRVEVVAGGRGAAARERLVALWLPAPDGGISLADSLAEESTGGVAQPIVLSPAG